MMLSTSSYSKTLIRDNLSRFSVLPLLGFVALFAAGILPGLMSYRRFVYVSQYSESVMKGSAFTINAIITVIAIISAVWVFGYLHENAQTNAMHRMPVTRNSLFGSAVISGWMMTAIPIIAFAIMTFVLRGANSTEKQMYDIYSSFMIRPLPAAEIFTAAHALSFAIKSLVTASFVFAVSCLAAVISGRKTIHALLAMFLLVLPVTLAVQTESLCRGYLQGFDGLNINYKLLGALGFAVSDDEFRIHAGYTAYYIVLSIALLALALWIYKRVRLERVGNATTFPVAGDILASLLTIICTLGTAQLFASATSGSEAEKPVRFVISALIASAVFYAIMRMIADSSPGIFNRKTLRQYGICLAIIAVITSITVLDVTGYSNRIAKIADAEDIENIHIKTGFPSNITEVDDDFTDPETIEAVAGLREAIYLDRKVSAENDYGSETFELTWKLKNGKEIKRTYEARTGKQFKKTNAALENLYESEAYKEKIAIDVETVLKKTDKIELYGTGVYGSKDEDYVRIGKEDEKELLEAVNKDLKAVSYDRIKEYTGESDTEDLVYVEISYIKADADDGSSGCSYAISEKDKNAMQFLKNKGYIK